jgi:hypothetical protein
LWLGRRGLVQPALVLVRLALVLVWLAVVLVRLAVVLVWLVRRLLRRAPAGRVQSLRLLVPRSLPAVMALRVTRVVLLVAML